MADAALLVTAGATGVLAVAPYGSNPMISCLGTSLGRISQQRPLGSLRGNVAAA